ncbi:tyrosine-type recombinase/integrase [Neobacillus sp. NPDC093127]|uniref:tyrosine-type recombinase/integrase n=1 Tax=Neobacillus sp. NPDC093127 TaxID=3364296 RepID=UPI0038010738
MASIQKLKNGWRYRVSYKDGDKYKTKTQGGFRTKKEAEIAAAELEKKLHVGHDITSGDRLFAEYIRSWYEIYKKGKHSPKHGEDIERSVKLVEEHFPGVRMKDLTRDMYQRFINELAPKYAHETLRKRHLYIKQCLADAREDGVISKSPTYKVKVKGQKKEKAEDLKYLNYGELKRLVAETQKNLKLRYISRYIILFGIATGARFSEILGMTWDGIDFKNQTVTINKTWDLKYKNDFSDTKNYASMRTITIDEDMTDILKDLRTQQTKIAIQTGLRNNKNLVFVNDKMELVSNNAVNKTLKNLCKNIGATEITCHGLRHTHASTFLYKKVNIKYVSRRLGHKDIVTTLQTYSHIMDELEQVETRIVDETMADLFSAK